eukprot:gene34530-biopygen32818
MSNLALDKLGFPKEITEIISNITDEATRTVLTEEGLTDEWSLECGVLQGEVLSPLISLRASQRTEFADKLDYAFAYVEELIKLLRAHGFKANVGLTLDGTEAESEFAVLVLANMSHVFGPIARVAFTKLLDFEFEYDEYHLTLNELVYVVLPTTLRGTAISLYAESARVHPHDGRCALRRLRFHVEGIGDPDAHRFL